MAKKNARFATRLAKASKVQRLIVVMVLLLLGMGKDVMMVVNQRAVTRIVRRLVAVME